MSIKFPKQWRPVRELGFEDAYCVSRQGEVMRVKKSRAGVPGKILTPFRGAVTLSNNGYMKRCRIEKLAANAYPELRIIPDAYV